MTDRAFINYIYIRYFDFELHIFLGRSIRFAGGFWLDDGIKINEEAWNKANEKI